VKSPRCSTSVPGITARVSSTLRDRIGSMKHRLWFGDSARFGVDENTLQVTVPSRFHADWISRNFHAELNEAATEAAGRNLNVRFDVQPDVFSQPSFSTDGEGRNVDTKQDTPHNHQLKLVPAPVPDTNGISQSFIRKSNGNGTNRNLSTQSQTHTQRNITQAKRTGQQDRDRYDLDRFIVGPPNELAHRAACRMTGDHPFAESLFIHGGCGQGKTHLLQGICRAYHAQHPPARIRYMTGEQFTNEYITAVRTNRLDTFRKNMRRLDLLAVDDVHFLSNKRATQQEFLCTFDAIGQSRSRVVLASDEPPRHVQQLQEKLVSRFLSGMVVEVGQPDREMCRALLTIMAKRRGMTFNETALNTLAEHRFASVREIEGTVTQLHALLTLNRQLHSDSEKPAISDPNTIGMILVRQLFRDTTPLPSQPIRPSHILEVISSTMGVEMSEIKGKSRHQRIVLARSIASYLIRTLTTLSLSETASAMGRRHHSTILAAVQRVNQDIQSERLVSMTLEAKPIPIRDLIESITATIHAER